MIDLAYIGLGSNVGDRSAFLARGRAALAELPETVFLTASSIEETEPLGEIPQEKYLNQMVVVETALSPQDLMSHLLEIEAREGRARDVRWGPRTLDLDIVRLEWQTVDEPDLHVPHLELPNRAFWQRELTELRGAP
ncbi:MAG TPA: 2-amino-4-hydroxy-6-hydroxymethyldihydropteridine diphosphokinase [Gemmatimonadaceae bacterium]|nr:2-amino-4-hydroxy-6-hydroxymethyldihydropteridine diphosphokinase [Gemmatimonadaceae bacterium]